MAAKLQVCGTITDTTNWRPYLDWGRMVSFGTFTVGGVSTDLGKCGGTYLDANGDFSRPMASATYTLALFYHLQDVSNFNWNVTLAGYQFKLLWDNGTSVTGVVISNGATGTLTAGSFAWTQTSDGVNTSNANATITWVGTDPPTNIKLVLAANETSLSAGNTLDPTYVTNIGQWKVLRVTDIASQSIHEVFSTAISITSANVNTTTNAIAKTAHGLYDSDAFLLGSEYLGTSVLPSPLAKATVYYAKRTDADNFQISATAGGAAIDLTTQGSNNFQILPNPISFSDIATTSHRKWNKRTTLGGGKVGPPISVLTDLSTQTGVAIWYCLWPTLSDAAVTSIANAFKNGTSNMVYFEFGNEIWNGTDGHYSDLARAASGYSALKWSGYRSAQMMELIRAAYGTDSGTRWTGVVGTQGANAGVTSAFLTGIGAHINADVGAANSINKLYGHIALAPYYGPYVGSLTTGIGLLLSNALAGGAQKGLNGLLYDNIKFGAASDSDWQSLAWLRTQWQALVTTSTQAGLNAEEPLLNATGALTVIMYEGGPTSLTVGSVFNDAVMAPALANWAISSQCADLFYAMCIQAESDGVAICSKLSSHGIQNKNGPWAAQQSLTDMSDMYRAMQKFNGSLTGGRLR